MLSGVANLLFGTSSDEPEMAGAQEVDVPTRDAELGWVVVDLPSSMGKSSNEEGRQQQQHGGECPPSPHICDLRVPVEIPEGDSSCPSDPESTGSQPQPSPGCSCAASARRPSDVCLSNIVRVESWVLTPPPCFTGRRKRNVGVEDSPLENLLIEHPSMSVYNSYGGDSTGEDSNQSDVEMEEEAAALAASRRTRYQVHHPPRRPYAVASRVGLVAHIENVKYAQRKKLFQDSKSLSKKKTMRSNRVNEFQSHGKHQQHRNRASRPSGCMNGRIGQRKF